MQSVLPTMLGTQTFIISLGIERSLIQVGIEPPGVEHVAILDQMVSSA
jgi:hypothetical protein